MEVQLLAFLISALDEVRGQHHALVILPLGKDSCYPWDRWLDKPQSQLGWMGGEEKNISLPRIKSQLSSLEPVIVLFVFELSQVIWSKSKQSILAKSCHQNTGQDHN
jgi:hypothetical protein